MAGNVLIDPAPGEGIDPSIIGKLQPPQVNPLTMMTQALEIQHGVSANQSAAAAAQAAQAELKAHQAWGAAVQAHTGADGNVDLPGLMADLKNSPDAAYLAPEINKDVLAQQIQQQNLTQQHLDTFTKRLGVAGNILLPRIADQQPITGDEWKDMVGQIVKTGLFKDPASMDYLVDTASHLAPTQGADGAWNDAATRTGIKELFVRGHAGAEGIQAAFGANATLNTGGAIQPGKQDQFSGGFTPDGAPVPLTMTPGEKAARISGTDDQGKPFTVPQSTLTTDTGDAKATAGLTGPHGELQGGLSPAAQAGATTAATNAAQMATSLAQRVQKVPDNKALLGNLDGLLDKFSPGPQSQFWKTFGQVASEYGVKMPGAPPPDRTAAQEEFGKLAFQLAQSQFQALGGTGTDSKLDSTMHTSPSELLTRYGNHGIIALLKGNEDAIAAQGQAWQKWQDAGHGPETYNQFQSQWTRIYDPRVFQSQYMDTADRQTMLKGMTDAEKAKFQTDYKRAVGLGWVK